MNNFMIIIILGLTPLAIIAIYEMFFEGKP